MTPEAALSEINAHADPERASGAEKYHKAKRVYLGVPNPVLNDLTKTWRQELPVPDRVALADALWQTDIHEARIAAAKLLTQARMKPDDTPAWRLIVSWLPDFDAWAIADHACMAGQRRLSADPGRIDEVEVWTQSDSMWIRRAALVTTLPWTKQNHPKPADEAIRDRVLGWAAGYVTDPDWFIQKAVAWWVRELSKHDSHRAREFLKSHSHPMREFAKKEAAKYL